MNVKRYFAPTAREALRALKEALGPDAIVLSNRAVEGGVEILALPGEAVGALQAANRAAVVARAGGEVRPAAVEMPAAAARSADDADFRVSLSALAASAARNASRPVA
ncbi:MAG TPA: flagellar biosynthesis protein FlhF, partial [Thauera aminoaromatica]|nr:flagellar biosynthesis protein FlhF [Thauera aminoaromatica]